MENNRICKRCNQPIAGQINLPHVPPYIDPENENVFSDEPYHAACLKEELSSTSLVENPNLLIKLDIKANEAFALVNRLRNTDPADGDEAVAFAKIKRHLMNALANHDTLYVYCANEAHCKTQLISYKKAIRGIKTFEANYPDVIEIDKHKKFSEWKDVNYFCSPQCDTMFASSILKERERQKQEEEKSKREKQSSLTQAFVKIVEAIDRKQATEEQVYNHFGKEMNWSREQIAAAIEEARNSGKKKRLN